jgi:hypothetical protein
MSTIRLLSFWNAERKAQKLYRENAWWAHTGSGFNFQEYFRSGTDFGFSDAAQKITASYWQRWGVYLKG